MQVRPPSLGNGKNVPVEGMKGVGGEEVPKGGESWLAVEKIPGGVQRAARNSGATSAMSVGEALVKDRT